MKNRTIQARIEDETYKELEFLKHELGMPETTQVISFALRQLFSERKQKLLKKSPFELMDEMGLIGSMSGPANLSERYKETITKSLREKHALTGTK